MPVDRVPNADAGLVRHLPRNRRRSSASRSLDLAVALASCFATVEERNVDVVTRRRLVAVENVADDVADYASADNAIRQTQRADAIEQARPIAGTDFQEQLGLRGLTRRNETLPFQFYGALAAETALAIANASLFASVVPSRRNVISPDCQISVFPARRRAL